MSLRQEILNEIKNMLNEVTTQELSTTRANIQIGKLAQYFDRLPYDEILKANPAIATDLLEAYYVLFSKKEALSTGGMTVGNALQLWQKMDSDKKKVICRLGNDKKYSSPIDLPSGGTITLCEKSAPNVPPAPAPPTPVKAEQGKCKPPFVGLNGGVTSGPKVTEVQKLLAEKGFLNAGYAGGTIDAPTNNAIFDLQRRLAPMGNKIASGLGGTYEGTAIKPDGCYGPKTSCAASLFYNIPDMYGNNKTKCMAILKIRRGGAAAAATALPANPGMLDLTESKNWLDRTREDASSSLFERLVKDVSNKKVI